MDKLSILLCSTMLCTTTSIMAQADFATLPDDVQAKAISPNGNYVVGSKGYYGEDAMQSFVWDTESKETTWKTMYDAANLDKSGQFMGVNDNGVIVGTMKDKDMTKDVPASDWNDAYTLTFNTAAVWKNGSVTKLGIGDNTTDDFMDEMDGSYAVAVSEDASVVAGYIYKSYMPCVPCGWKWNYTSNKYEYFTYKLPTTNAIGSINAMSADGKVAVGTVSYDGANRPVVWTSADSPKELMLGTAVSDVWSAGATSVSANGKYVAVYVFGPSPALAVYDVETGKTTNVDINEVGNVKSLVIDNNGNLFCQIANNTDYIDNTYYFSFADKSLMTLEYYASVYANGVTTTLSNTTSVPTGVSADGTMVIGNDTQSGQTWWLKRMLSGVSGPAVTNVEAFFTGVGKASVIFDKPANIPSTLTLKSFDLYIDGKKTASKAASEPTRFDINLSEGVYTLYVKAVYDNDGKEIMSDKSGEITMIAPLSYEMPLKEDFEAATLTENCWTQELTEGSNGEVLTWNVSGGDFENNTYFANVANTAYKPYRAVLTSRFFKAAEDGKAPFLTFYAKRLDINEVQSNLNTEFLDVEASTDGENWTKMSSIKAADTDKYNWSYYNIDLASLAGKDFQLRFVAHGEGQTTMKWCLDYVTVATSHDGKAPKGVRCIKNGNDAKIEWKNNVGAYEVTSLTNSAVITDYNTGNEGKPMITAVDFGADKFKDYVGMYITSVADFLYDSPYGSTTQATKAEAIVYADGVEVARGKFADDCALNSVSSVAPLDKPVKIEAGKGYRIAVRIYDYASDQTPLYYQSDKASPEWKAGVTDLYSEDEGKTWNSIYDFNKNDEESGRAYCIWPIRACITETQEAPSATLLENKLIACNVFKNGERINTIPVYAASRSFTDNAYTDGAEYRVQAYYNNCNVSPMSDAATIVLTAINGTLADNDNRMIADGKTLVAANGAEDITIFDTAGNIVRKSTGNSISTANLNRGVYILKVTKANKTYTYKAVIK